ncbi:MULTISPECIES: hypothetical protein [Sphingobium]|uniref:hypothetical protein n=1 Tax=Sphingobium TaxID=165695 RepID=UPI0015EBB5E5|nr:MULTISPECIES: hypothetical protein [Sphingobium]MCW2362451.1 hypothetical protein [Sphingobium sp. B10D3B]MCW2400869.1 hypothetical protein [Sphingobium sp. B10D7B]MCW2407848.1 hypothetical protein [Sphingobium xanthum]
MLGGFGGGSRANLTRAPKPFTAKVPSKAGVVFTLPMMGLLSPVTFTKTTGPANLTVLSGGASTGAIVASLPIAVDETQEIGGYAFGADGCRKPWSASLTAVAPTPTPTPTPALDAPTVSPLTVVEALAPGAEIATITGQSGNSYSLADDAGGRLAIASGSKIVAGLTPIAHAETASLSFQIATANAGTNPTSRTDAFTMAVQEAVQIDRVDLRYNTADTRWEVANASAFPGATYVYKTRGGTTLSTTSAATLAAASTSEGVTAEVEGQPATKSAVVFKIVSDLNQYLDFADAPSGTPLSALGWTSPAQFVTDGVALTRTSSAGTFPLRNVGKVNQKIRFRPQFKSDPANGNDGSSSQRGFLLAATPDDRNWVNVSISTGNIGINKRANNQMEWSYIPTIGGSNLEATWFEIELNWISDTPYLKISRGGVRVDPGGNGINLNATGGTLLPGTNVGIAMTTELGVSNPSWPQRLIHELQVSAWDNRAVNVGSMNVPEPSASAPPAVVVTGTTTNTGQHNAWGVDEYGRVVSGPFPFIPSAGAYSVTMPFDLLPPYGAYIAPVDAPNDGIFAEAPVMPVFEAIEPHVFGVNSSPTSASNPVDIVKDRGRVVSWRYIHTSNGTHSYIPDEDRNADGWPAVQPPAGYSICAIIWEGAGPGGRFGAWNLTTNADSTISTTWTPENVTVSNVTSRGARLTQTSATAASNITLRFANVTVPPEGFQLSVLPVLPQGEEHDPSELMTPQVAAIWHSDNFGGVAGNMWWRNMKVTMAEAVDPKLPYFAGSKEFGVSVCKQTKGSLFWTFPYDEVANHLETKVANDLTYFLAHAPIYSRSAGEVANEVWNYSTYNKQWWTMAVAGANRGFLPGVAVPSGGSITLEVYTDWNPTGGVISGGKDENGTVTPGKTRRVFNPGEVILCGSSNYQAVVKKVVALSPVPVGTDVWEASDANFQTLGLFDAINTSARREQSYQQMRLGNLGREILGDRFTSVLGTFLGDQPNQVASYLLWNESWQGIDYFSPSFYAGEAQDYTTTAWAQQHTSNFANFKTNFHSRFRTTAATTVDKLKLLKHGTRRIMLAEGVPAELCPKMGFLYEGFDHNTFIKVPSAQQAGLKAAVSAVLASREDKAEAAIFNGRLRNEVGGVMCYFADVEKVTYNSWIEQMQWFGMRQYSLPGPLNNNDADEQRYLALLNHFGAV